MKIILFFSFILSSSFYLQAQDTILKRDGNEQIGKIIEVNESQVKYKSGGNVNGPTYVLSKENIKRIAYSNGTVDNFPEKENNQELFKPDPRNTDFGRHFISINAFDLFNGLLTLGYEYTFKSGDFSIKVPFSFGLISLGLADSISGNYHNDNDNEYYNRNKIFSTGLDFYCYPLGQGKSRYFMGVSFEYGIVKYWDYYYNNLTPYNYIFQKEYSHYYALVFQNGFLVQPTKHINISINAGIGYCRQKGYYDYQNNDNYRGYFVFRGGISFGYKF